MLVEGFTFKGNINLYNLPQCPPVKRFVFDSSLYTKEPADLQIHSDISSINCNLKNICNSVWWVI